MSIDPIWISSAALTVSIGGLVVSVCNFRRDAARLKIRSEYFEGYEDSHACIKVSMVNVGRRPVILRFIGGSSGEKWSGTYIDHETGGKRLGENEHYEKFFERHDLVALNHPEDAEEFTFENLWVEDSLGVRHQVPKSREYIKRLVG